MARTKGSATAKESTKKDKSQGDKKNEGKKNKRVHVEDEGGKNKKAKKVIDERPPKAKPTKAVRCEEKDDDRLVPTRRQFNATVHTRSRLEIIDTIRKGLTADEAAQFKTTCFGQFWYLSSKINFQGQLYLQLLFDQDLSGSSHEVVFHVRDQTATFGPREFVLMTGLRFGEEPSSTVSSDLYTNVFGDKKSLTLIDIEKAFGKPKNAKYKDIEV